jgi:CspA family cold shock protein
MRGEVVWFSDSKGFGFLSQESDANTDIFVHFSAIQQEGFKSLKQGQKVEYDIGQNAKGKIAINVRVLEG